MQKALDQLNFQIHCFLNDISGVSGLRILDAILAGERDPYQLFPVYCELVSAERSPELVDTIQSVFSIQSAFARALLVDYDALEKSRAAGDIR